MPNVVTTLQPNPKPQVFAGLPSGSNNIYPRARIIFEGGVTVPAKGAGDTSTMKCQINLPVNFAYALDESVVSVGSGSTTDAANVDNLGYVEIYDGTAMFQSYIQLKAQGESLSGNANGSLKIFNAVESFHELIFNRNGSAPFLTSWIYDQAAGATGSFTLRCYFSFLQYDIDQVTEVAVNAPMPVRVQ